MTAVVDANAGIEVGLNRSRSKDITCLLRRFDQILTPSLYYAEITNALWKYLRSNRIGSDTAKQGLRIASELIDQYIDIQKVLLVYISVLRYRVTVTNKAAKTAAKMPMRERKLLASLLDALTENGPVQAGWPNYSKLGPSTYHCHLSYHWVACWRETGQFLTLEVYYAGLREGAPY